ncbi:MAG: phage terminase large subunit family protein [Thiobacillus sp.]|nr:phage terminase large subunit family protein [Thiobacillus sp.]
MSDLADGFDAFMACIHPGLRPDPALHVDEWADEFMRIPRGNGSEAGKYRTARTPYAREVMRCLSPSHPAKRVVAKVASQLFKTQVGLNWVGANIHLAPANMLVLLPTDKLAKRVSSRIGKTIDEVPELRDRVAAPRSRDSRNTVDTKEFNGGTLYITTAGSAANLAEVPARYIYGDEIDRWDVSVDDEGSPIDLAETRASTFGRNAKFYYTSSPTEEGASAIDDLFKMGDQRRYYVPCPHCGHMHILAQENLRWDDAFDAAWMLCPGCGEGIHEQYKGEMLAAGEWRAHADGDGETVSFELSALYAPPGWVSWVGMAKQYTKAKAALDRGDIEPMQVYYNTRLALCWDNVSERFKADQVKALAEDFPLGVVPARALLLTAAVDVQGNRLEMQVFGWAHGMERWTVNYHVISGDPAEKATWDELDQILKTPIRHASGRQMVIRAVGIDTGGHHTQEVYDFCRKRKRRIVGGQEQRVLAIKGASKAGRPVISSRPSLVDVNIRGRIEKFGAEIWMIGTDTAKDWIYNRILLTTDGPGAIHYSKELPDEYFEQLVAEHKKVRYVKGYKVIEWHKKKADRNEAFDLTVYNLGMAHHLELHRKPDAWWRNLEHSVRQGDLLAAAVPDHVPAAAVEAAVQPPAPAPTITPAPAVEPRPTLPAPQQRVVMRRTGGIGRR